MSRKGFTLIELIMVIVIIGILAAIAVPRFVNLRAAARQAQCQGSVGAIRAALSNYYAWYSVNSNHYNDRYPTRISALGAYFQDNAMPASPGWTTAAQTWDSWYTSGTTGVISDTAACLLGNF